MAQLIRGTLLPGLHQERLLFMDKFGKPFLVYLDFSQAANRADTISSTIAIMNTAETQTSNYAVAAGVDLTAQIAAGTAAIAAALADQNS